MVTLVSIIHTFATTYQAVMGKHLHTWHEYLTRLHRRISPALNQSSVLQRFERSNAIEIRNRIIFDFYSGLRKYM